MYFKICCWNNIFAELCCRLRIAILIFMKVVKSFLQNFTMVFLPLRFSDNDAKSCCRLSCLWTELPAGLAGCDVRRRRGGGGPLLISPLLSSVGTDSRQHTGSLANQRHYGPAPQSAL